LWNLQTGIFIYMFIYLICYLYYCQFIGSTKFDKYELSTELSKLPFSSKFIFSIKFENQN